MRTNRCLPVLSIALAFLPLVARGQIATTATNAPLDRWQASIKDWHSTAWGLASVSSNATTGQLQFETRRFTEVGSGMNYIDPNGIWQRSADLIELMTNGGAAALHGPTKVYFSPTLGADGPTIQMVSLSNVVLQVQPSALYYVDDSGASALLATFRPDAVGELVPPNRVVYRAATTNGINCAVSYVYTHGAFESDLLILSQPTVTPDMLGLNPATARLSLTHSVAGPMPTVTHVMTPVGLTDSRLDFAGWTFPQGFAFSTGGDTNNPSPGTPAQIQMPGSDDGSRVPVVKRIIPIGPGQWGLAEEVLWTDIKPKLETLPVYTQGASLSTPVKHASVLPPAPSVRGKGREEKPKMKVASGGYKPKAVDLDFISIVTGSNFVFEAGQTYFLSSSATFNGSVDLYGCVIKEANGASLWLAGPVNTHGTASNPSIITCLNDWAFGENDLPQSTGYPGFYGEPALRLTYTALALTLNYLTVRWAQTGLEVDSLGSGVTLNVLNSSFEWCQTGVSNYGCTVSLANCSKCNVTNALAGNPITGTLTDICVGSDPANSLPYTWEYEYFGTSGISGSADPDGDGLSNSQEYTDGTNPNVYDGPRIQFQPQSQTVVQGSNAIFNVVATTGTAALSYQWYKGGQPISGATSSSLTLTNAQLANSDYYFVIVTNSYGIVSSPSAFLSISTPTNGVPTPGGIVSWWPGQSNANDIVSGNNGSFSGTYANGEVAQAFNVVSPATTVRVAASQSLNVGASSGLTLEGWINPADFNAEPVFEWAPTNTYGVHVWVNFGGTGFVWVNIADIFGINHTIQSLTSPISRNAWQHLAVTYDKTSGNCIIYYNGNAITTNWQGTLSPQTGADFWLGCRPSTVNGNGNNFNGIIDEASVYNRALTPGEIQAIYSAGSYGKYLPGPPTISSQPSWANAGLGGTATFSATATGTVPLSYQWLFNGSAISGATASNYTVSNVQISNLGVYNVVIGSPRGSTLSAPASLNLTNSCFTPPTGLIDWWRAENNTTDQMGANNGGWVGASAYTNGEVGQAFSFSGAASNYVQIANSGSLQLTNAFTIELWCKDAGVSGYAGLIAKRPYTGACNFGLTLLGGSSPKVFLIYLLDPNYNSGNYQSLYCTNYPTDGGFHHIAATFNQTNSTSITVQAYLDGSLIATKSFSGNFANTLDTAPVTIGASNFNGEWFHGLMDEVSLYSRVLSGSEISNIWFSGTSGKCCLAPVIVTQPASQTVVRGNTATFSVGASGTPPLGYQWRFNGAAISGATSSTLNINNAQAANAGDYSVVVSNFVGTVTSATAALTVISPPVITTQPSNQVAQVGANVTFSVFASGTSPLSYQWYFNSQPIAGAFNSSYTIVNAQQINVGAYFVQITNLAGSATSSSASLTLAACVSVTNGLVSWWRAEGDARDAVGGNDGRLVGGASFTQGEVGQGFNLGFSQFVTVPSTPSLRLTNAFTIEMWYKDTGQPSYVGLISKSSPAANNFDIGIAPNNYLEMAFNDGGYKPLTIPAPVSGVFHHLAATYQQAGSQVQMQLYIDGMLKTNASPSGNLANAANDAPLKIGSDTPWSSPAAGTIDEVAIYSRVLSAGEISSIFNAGFYGKCLPTYSPAFVLQPTNLTTSVGNDLFFAGSASGSPTLSYQWYFNNSLLAGATNKVLLLTDVQTSQAGSYYLAVSNGLGATDSVTATLTLTNAVCITAPSGLVAWWKAESNTIDQIGDDTGFMLNSPFYTNGMVGTGFGLPNAYNYCFNFPITPLLLNSNAYTVEFWYKDTTGASGGAWTLVDQGPIGTSCSTTYAPSSFQFNISGQDYYFNVAIVDPTNGYENINYWPNPMPGMFHHMAGVFSQSSSNLVRIQLYIDGSSVANGNVYGTLANCLNSAPVTIGALGADADVNPFGGVIDEVSIYSRALTSAEVLSIFRAGPGGKCLQSTLPAIPAAGQPTNQTVAAGSEVLMTVFATGSPQLAYQWNYNGTLISGATNKAYVLSDVELDLAGNYSVLVTNALGAVMSQAATLTVTSPPSCLAVPSNMISWWRAEGTANDSSTNANNGVWVGNTNYLPAKVGQGFNFNGASYVQIADSPSLHASNGLTAELWYKDTGSTWNAGLISKLSAYAGFTVAIVPNAFLGVLFWDPAVGGQWINCSPVPAAGMFHHLAVTYQQQGSQVTGSLYIDGQCARSGMTWNGNLANALSANVPVMIGAVNNLGQWPFTGIIDEPTIYSRALSASEIRAIYNAGASGKCTTTSFGAVGITITSPTNLQNFTAVASNVPLQATVSDNLGGSVTNVQFYFGPVYGSNLIASTATASSNNVYNLTWNSNLWVGAYPLTALALDNKGATNASQVVLFKVKPTNGVPSVSITSPTNGAVFAAGSDVTIIAQASGSGGVSITNVQFSQNNSAIGSKSTTPFQITMQGVPPGTYTLQALASDTNGLQSNSLPVTIIVQQWLSLSVNGYWDSMFHPTNWGSVPDNVSTPVFVTFGISNEVYVSDQSTDVSGASRLWALCGWGSVPTTNQINGVQAINFQGPTLLMGGSSDGPSYVQQYNGTGFQNISYGISDEVDALQYFKGDLYAGGKFTIPSYIGKLGSNSWSQVGNNALNSNVWAIAAIGNDLYIGGDFTSAGGTNVAHVAKLSGSNWVPLGAGVNGTVRALGVWNGQLLVGGNFTAAGGDTNISCIAKWDGTSWSGFGAKLNYSGYYSNYAGPSIYAIAVFGNDVFLGGVFDTVSNSSLSFPAGNLAHLQWNPQTAAWTWYDLDQGVTDNSNYPDNSSGDTWVDSLSVRQMPGANSQELIVGGLFNQAGSVPSLKLARWVIGPNRCNGVYLPSVSINTPAPGAIEALNAQITLDASVTLTNTDQIASFMFLGDITNIVYQTTVSAASYSTNWTPPAVNGIHRVDAVATDTNGISAKATVFVTVGSSSGLGLSSLSKTVSINSPPVPLYVLSGSSATGISWVSPGGNGSLGSGSIVVGPGATNLIFTPGSDYGTNVFWYTATNATAYEQSFVTIRVAPVPAVQITYPLNGLVTNTPVTLTVSGTASDADGSVTNLLILTNGVQYASFTPASTSFTTNWTAPAAGFYTLTAVATEEDGYTTTSAPVTVDVTTASGNIHPPIAEIDSPAEVLTNVGALAWYAPYTVVNGQLSITGKVYSPDNAPVAWQVLLLDPTNPNNLPLYNITPGPLNAEGFRTNAVTFGSLGTNFDLSMVQNGSYQLTLVVQSEGLQTNANVQIQVASNLKIGQFSFSEQDLIVPVNGIPLTVIRTYNSIDPLSSDFGYGWTFSINSMDVQLDDQRTPVVIGSPEALFATQEEDAHGAPLSTSIRTGGGHDVTLTLPDGRRTTFMFNPIYQPLLSQATASWVAPPDVHAILGVNPPSSAVIELLPGLAPYWADNGDDSSFDYHDIPGFVLTNYDGTQYFLNRGPANLIYYTPDPSSPGYWANTYGPPTLGGILQRSGDLITISSNGISHSIGNSTNRTVAFTRDGFGRITAINDPNGTGAFPVTQYVYDKNGNLIQALKLLDRNAGTYSTNRYWYTNSFFPHYITEIDNGDGSPVARNTYDSNGRLVSTVDANGNTTQFVHNLTNSLEVVVDRRSNTTSYAYDPRGNVIATTNALNGVTLALFDGANNKTNEVLFLGGVRYATNNFSYDTNGMLLVSVNSLGFSNVLTYNSFGQVLTSTDARGYGLTNSYDNFGNLVGTLDALGNTTANFYAPNTQLLSGSRDAVGTLTTNSYDGSGNLIGTETFVGANVLSTNTFGYDSDGNRTSSTVWRRVNGYWSNAVTSFIYDGQNRVVQTIDPDGGTNLVVFDPAGRQTQTIDKLNRTTGYSYDWAGHLVVTTFPDSTTTTNVYDANGNRIQSIDQLGRTNSYVYDALNRLTLTTFADATTNLTVYDDLGRVKLSVDGRGTTTAFGYDAVNRRVAMTNALGVSGLQMTNGFLFDRNDNQIGFIDGASNTTSYSFDALNRQTMVTFPNNSTQITIYDAAGRRVGAVDQANITNWFAYDGAGRLTAVTNALGSAQYAWAQYQYDEAGNQTAQIDALNRTTAFLYDTMGRRLKRTLPGLQWEGFGYDLMGNVLRYTNFNGTIITNQYDRLNRLIARSSTNGYNVSFAYSPSGQRTNMIDVTGVIGYTYDKRDRLLSKSVNRSNGPSVWLNYSYDAAGNLTNLFSTNLYGGTVIGVTNCYQFDLLNRLTNVLASGSQAAAYGFDKVGNLQSMSYGNGVTNQYSYDSLNRLTNLANTKATFSYQLGATGNRTSLTENLNGASRSYTWVYDSLHRLTNETFTGGTTGTVGYNFDLVSNRTNRTSNVSGVTNQVFAFNSNDWLTNTDTYDSNGSTTASTTNSYSYDPLCHLISANGVTFAYDGDGNRVRKTINGTNVFYLQDDHNPSGYAQTLEEWTVAGGATNLSRIYNFGLALISQKQGSTTYYFGQDGHGSTRLLFDSTGAVINAFAFDAYGVLISSTTTSQTAYLYCGEYFDPDTGQYYLRARWLNSGTGRFGTLDTFQGNNEDPLSLHKYVYGANNPVNLTDPTGRDFDMVSLMASTTLGVGLDSMYNGTVTTVGNALQGTIMGVQHGYSANQILASYYLDTAIGIGGGFVLGKVIGAVDEAIFGAEVEFTGSTAPEARAAVRETEQGAVEAARQSQLFFFNKQKGQGVDLMLPIDLQEGGYLFSTKAPNTISHGLWATDEVGVSLAAGSASAYSRGVQIAPGNKTIYAYKIKQRTSGAFGYARANAGPQGSIGKGGFPQYYIRQQDVGNLEPAYQFQFSQ